MPARNRLGQRRRRLQRRSLRVIGLNALSVASAMQPVIFYSTWILAHHSAPATLGPLPALTAAPARPKLALAYAQCRQQSNGDIALHSMCMSILVDLSSAVFSASRDRFVAHPERTPRLVSLERRPGSPNIHVGRLCKFGRNQTRGWGSTPSLNASEVAKLCL